MNPIIFLIIPLLMTPTLVLDIRTGLMEKVVHGPTIGMTIFVATRCLQELLPLHHFIVITMGHVNLMVGMQFLRQTRQLTIGSTSFKQ
jgi:hypothetical protein